MKICCLTCTGDRKEALDLSRAYFLRAKNECPKDWQIDWVVVDDGITEYNPGDCQYIRRIPDGPNSLGRNLLEGLTKCDCSIILMWEDDDWYRKDRILAQANMLHRRSELHGWSNTIYYNVQYRMWRQHQNFAHASLFETGMTRSMADMFYYFVKDHVDESFLDLGFWRTMSSCGKLTPFDGTCIGIKGMPGRNGLGSGHKFNMYYNSDDGYTRLNSFIGQDSESYKKYWRYYA